MSSSPSEGSESSESSQGPDLPPMFPPNVDQRLRGPSIPSKLYMVSFRVHSSNRSPSSPSITGFTTTKSDQLPRTDTNPDGFPSCNTYLEACCDLYDETKDYPIEHKTKSPAQFVGLFSSQELAEQEATLLREGSSNDYRVYEIEGAELRRLGVSVIAGRDRVIIGRGANRVAVQMGGDAGEEFLVWGRVPVAAVVGSRGVDGVMQLAIDRRAGLQGPDARIPYLHLYTNQPEVTVDQVFKYLRAMEEGDRVRTAMGRLARMDVQDAVHPPQAGSFQRELAARHAVAGPPPPPALARPQRPLWIEQELNIPAPPREYFIPRPVAVRPVVSGPPRLPGPAPAPVPRQPKPAAKANPRPSRRKKFISFRDPEFIDVPGGKEFRAKLFNRSPSPTDRTNVAPVQNNQRDSRQQQARSRRVLPATRANPDPVPRKPHSARYNVILNRAKNFGYTGIQGAPYVSPYGPVLPPHRMAMSNGAYGSDAMVASTVPRNSLPRPRVAGNPGSLPGQSSQNRREPHRRPAQRVAPNDFVNAILNPSSANPPMNARAQQKYSSDWMMRTAYPSSYQSAETSEPTAKPKDKKEEEEEKEDQSLDKPGNGRE